MFFNQMSCRKWYSAGILLVLLCFPIIGWAQDSLEDMQKAVKKHEALIESQKATIAHLQKLITELFQQQSGLKSASLQESFDGVLDELSQLQDEVRKLQTSVKQIQKAMKFEKKQNEKSMDYPLILGLLSLEANDPNRAVDYFQPFLDQDNATFPKDTLLFLLGNGFTTHQSYEQAASYYASLIQGFPKSPHHIQSLYSLGTVFGYLNDREKQKIVWKALITNYPKHPLAQKARGQLEQLEED